MFPSDREDILLRRMETTSSCPFQIYCVGTTYVYSLGKESRKEERRGRKMREDGNGIEITGSAPENYHRSTASSSDAWMRYVCTVRGGLSSYGN